MQNHAAVFRDGPALKEGVDKMYAINKEMDDVKVYWQSTTIIIIFRKKRKKCNINFVQKQKYNAVIFLKWRSKLYQKIQQRFAG